MRTKSKSLDSDLFIKWFKENYAFLKNTAENRKHFITQHEIIAEFMSL